MDMTSLVGMVHVYDLFGGHVYTILILTIGEVNSVRDLTQLGWDDDTRQHDITDC